MCSISHYQHHLTHSELQITQRKLKNKSRESKEKWRLFFRLVFFCAECKFMGSSMTLIDFPISKADVVYKRQKSSLAHFDEIKMEQMCFHGKISRKMGLESLSKPTFITQLCLKMHFSVCDGINVCPKIPFRYRPETRRRRARSLRTVNKIG